MARSKMSLSAPPVSLEVDGAHTASREAWRSAAHELCSTRYGDEKNEEKAQFDRKERVRGWMEESKAAGEKPPRLELLTVFIARSRMNEGTVGGPDGLVSEVWKAVPLILVIAILELFVKRHLGGELEVPAEWSLIDLVCIPKVKKPLDVSQFRFIARLPVLQKWYLRSIIELVNRSVDPSPVHTYGFKKGCRIAHITELLREILHLSRKWGRDAYILQLDVRTEFGSMSHGEIVLTLRRRGVHPYLIGAVEAEYRFLIGRVILADADVSEQLAFLRGGRQGGIETPSLYTTMMEDVAGDLVEDWNEKGLGFQLEEGSQPVNHALWADNFFIIGGSWDQVSYMLRTLTVKLYALGFTWKPDSPELLPSQCSKTPDVTSFLTPDGVDLELQVVGHLVCLGVYLDNVGSTSESFNYRATQADKSFYANLKTLQKKEGPVAKRFEAFSAVW